MVLTLVTLHEQLILMNCTDKNEQEIAQNRRQSKITEITTDEKQGSAILSLSLSLCLSLSLSLSFISLSSYVHHIYR